AVDLREGVDLSADGGEALAVPAQALVVHDPGGRRLERDEGVVLAAEVRLEVSPDGAPGDVAGVEVVRAHERLLARLLVNVDRDHRNLWTCLADSGRGIL